MQTVDVNNNKSSETHYVTLVDIKNMDSCDFSNKTNPITNSKCNEAFKPLGFSNVREDDVFLLPKDPLTKLYFFCLSMTAIYILYKLMEKGK
jgi:hypothetical protein